MFNKKIVPVKPYELPSGISVMEYRVEIIRGPIVVILKIHDKFLNQLLQNLVPEQEGDTSNNVLTSIIQAAWELGCGVHVTTTEPDSFPIWILGKISHSSIQSIEGITFMLAPKK